MKSSILFRRSTLLVLAAGMFSGASAADYQWDANGANPGLGGTGTWNAANALWDDLSAGANDGTDTTQAVTFSASHTATFAGTAGTVTLTSGLYYGIINVTTGGYIFTTGANTLENYSGLVTIASTGTTTFRATGNNGTMRFNGGIALNGGTLTLSKFNSGGNGPFTFTGGISGAGTINLQQGGATAEYNFGANTYSGTTNLTGGRLNISNASALGTSTLTITGGAFNATAAGITLNNNVQNWNGDFAFVGTNNLNMGTGAVTLGGNRTVTVSANTLTVGGVIDDGVDTYSLTKAGAGSLSLNGINTYSGDTIVNAGTLSITESYLDDGSSVSIGATGVLNLSFAGIGDTDTVDKLFINGVQQTTGTWGSTASGATHIDDTHFTGTGTLTVTTAPDPLIVVASTVTATTNSIATALSIPVSNNGATQPLIISAITPAGANAASFVVDSTLPINIAPGGSSTINYTFTPTTGPGAYTATFDITSNDLTQSPKTVTVFNDGGAQDLSISGTTIIGASEFAVTSAPTIIAPGNSAPVEITFTPGSGFGRFNGTLQIASNDYNGATPSITLTAFVEPSGTVAARFNFDPNSVSGTVVDIDTTTLADVVLGSLTDMATGLGALGAGNQTATNRALATGVNGSYLNFSSNRESDAQTPVAAGGSNEATWTTVSIAPEPGGGQINFAGGSAVIDTYANTDLGSNTAANWTLYYSTDSGSTWTPLSAAAAGQATTAGTKGPLGITWDLSVIGNQTAPVLFALDAVSTGNTNGSVTQRGVGFDNFVITAGSITPGAAIDYTSWAYLNGVTGGPNGDSDNDGIKNLVEYALNLNFAGSDGSAGTLTGNMLSFTKRPEAVTNGDVTYAIETSPDLLNSWTPVSYILPDVNNGTTISYTLPTGLGKIFARLVVTQKP